MTGLTRVGRGFWSGELREFRVVSRRLELRFGRGGVLILRVHVSLKKIGVIYRYLPLFSVMKSAAYRWVRTMVRGPVGGNGG